MLPDSDFSHVSYAVVYLVTVPLKSKVTVVARKKRQNNKRRIAYGLMIYMQKEKRYLIRISLKIGIDLKYTNSKDQE